ncbi:Peptidase family protein [Peptoniphilus sp. ING2-D1G]|nr:Peptidase family protein [Peptoniphilus sp. ING2-D1G]
MNKYKLITEEYIDDVASTAKIYEHLKTKAKVLILSNNDENKAFSISFRTVPEDSTGVPHIVEHCVLSGSRKYRTKEPFMDMIKGSMQTFLNAMTYPDKTMYPVSSRNKKDFYNLMDVYLDSVFYPLMYEKEEIFRQEGWHYELEDKDSELTYNGVVYNEMKGVYSDEQNIVSDLITFNLHENSSYGVDSGGNPEDIPNLSYENFLAFHKKFYHPSNSYIYLYGDLDMEEALEYIDENYLSDFDYKEIDSQIKLNIPFDEPRTVHGTFSASEIKDDEHKDYLAYSWCIGKSDDKLDSFMQNFLIELLVNSNSAPIKRALLEKNLAEDVYAEGSSSLALDISIIAKNTDSSRSEEFKKTIFDTLKSIVKEGLDKDLLEATLNKFEFSFREGGGTMKSIIYNIRAMNSWLYDKSPIDGLKTNDLIKELRENINSDFFEKYIEEKLLNNNYALLLIAEPEIDKDKKTNQKTKNKLQDYKNSLEPWEIQDMIDETHKLFDFQLSEDSPEDKSTIPTLEISDINKEITHIPMEITKKEDKTYLFSEQFTNEISYVTFSFDASHVKKDEVANLSLLSDLIGKLSTNQFDYAKLDSEIYKVLGNYSLNPVVYANYKNSDEINPRFNVSFKTLDINFEKSLNLIKEILLNTQLDDKNRIKEILQMEKSADESTLLQNGHVIMIETVKSYFLKQSDYASKISGLENYFYLRDLVSNFEEKWDEFRLSLEGLMKSFINSRNLIVHFTGSRKSYEENSKFIENFISQLPDEPIKKQEYEFKKQQKNQGFSLPANVQYISKGYDLKELGAEYNGAFSVLANILSSTYLHDNIRAKGGAYGAGIRLSMSSDVETYSYRDPNLTKTIEVYDNMDKFVENLNLDEKDIKNFIIGTMNVFDPMLSPQGKGNLSFTRYMSSITEKEISNFKNEAINTKLEDLRSLAPLLKKAMDKNYMCAICGDGVLNDNKDLFKEIINLK